MFDDAYNADVVIMVGESPIFEDDVKWEYDFHLLGIENNEDMTFIPEVGDKLHEYLAPLKDRLVAGLVERKLLHEFIKKSRKIDLSRPELYTTCLSEWHRVLSESAEIKPLIKTAKDRERLKERICEWDIIRKYLDGHLYDKVKVSDEMVKQYFDSHKLDFSRGERALIRQIVLPSEKEASRIRNRLRSHNFAQLARKHSITPEAEDGGLLGPFSKGEMPRFFDVAFLMRVGEVRGVLKSTYGFHIIRLEKKLSKVEPSLDEVKDQIRNLLTKKMKEEEYQKWLEIALNSVSVKSPKPLW